MKHSTTMSSYRDLERRFNTMIEKGFMSLKSIGNDVIFFGQILPNARLQIAFSCGWMIEKSEYNGKVFYTLIPPPSFACGRDQWAAKYVDLVVDGFVISVPDWYYDDNVLTKGDYAGR